MMPIVQVYRAQNTPVIGTTTTTKFESFFNFNLNEELAISALAHMKDFKMVYTIKLIYIIREFHAFVLCTYG